MNVTHDGKLLIAIGRSRKASQWQNKEMLWSEFLDKLATTTRTRETVAEYAALPKGERDIIKDVGGFVCGYLKNGKRNNASVVNRCMLCLDADNADPGLMDDLDMTFINAYALYSTHSHTPEKMRLRLTIPLTRTVTTDEYAAVSRRVADDLGLLRFDPTTFEPARLMYWPSTSEDGEFFFHCEDAPFLDPDEVLKTYADWRDASLWPTTQPVEERIRHTAGKQEDPTEKRGIIGAFCRAHTVTDAMLSENPHAGVYEADTSRTLDCSGGSPACNQGGMLVVAPSEKPCYCIQGSMIGRKEQNGPQGDGVNHEVAFTLDTVDRHAVYAMTTGSFTQLDEEKSPPLMARDYKDPPVVGKDEPVYALDRACFSAGQNAQYSMNVGEEKAPTLVAEGPGAVAAPAEYLVRRLTPGECCRLQGYPDGWCENLESPAPSNKETDRWEAIFEEWRTAMGGKTKPKTRRQIIRWLQNPHTDSAEYKAYGNSIVAQCAFFVLAGIVWAQETEVNELEND